MVSGHAAATSAHGGGSSLHATVDVLDRDLLVHRRQAPSPIGK